MPDIVSPDVRSQMMSGIRGKNTGPELLLRRALHRNGFRYRLHVKALPGKPDIVFPSKKAIIMIHGCFWHGHKCHLFKWPSTRVEFWRKKIESNMHRDKEVERELSARGWRILTIWECTLKGRERISEVDVINSTIQWLTTENQSTELRKFASWPR